MRRYPHFSEPNALPTGESHWGRRVYRLATPMFVFDQPGRLAYTVPEGFRTDFATIPWPLCYLIRPRGRWATAAVLHDYLYSLPGYPRRVADAWFLAAMRAQGVTLPVRLVFFLAVRLAGWIWRR